MRALPLTVLGAVTGCVVGGPTRSDAACPSDDDLARVAVEADLLAEWALDADYRLHRRWRTIAHLEVQDECIHVLQIEALGVDLLPQGYDLLPMRVRHGVPGIMSAADLESLRTHWSEEAKVPAGRERDATLVLVSRRVVDQAWPVTIRVEEDPGYGRVDVLVAARGTQKPPGLVMPRGKRWIPYGNPSFTFRWKHGRLVDVQVDPGNPSPGD